MVGSGALVVSDVVWIQHALHTFGGRRIESPQGGDTAGHPLREHLAHRCQDTEAEAFEADVLWLGNISAIFRLRTAQ